MSFEELTPQMRRRVFKEIKKDNLHAEFIENDLYILLDISETMKKKLDIINSCIFLKLNLNNYPWNCPRITFIINNSNENFKENKLNKVYKTNKIFYEEMKILSGVNCLHCASYLCKDKWRPTSQIKNIIDEFKNIIDLKCRAVERLYCDKIQEQLVKSKNNNTINYLSKKDLRIADYL